MLKNLYRKTVSTVKRHARKVVMVGAAVFSMYAPAQAQERQGHVENSRQEYVVQEGDNLWDISERLLEEQGKATPRRTYWKANTLALMNDKGTLGQFPWEEGYDCETAEAEDPNCIYPGETIALENAEALEAVDKPEPEPTESETSYWGWGLLAILAASGTAEAYKIRKDRERRIKHVEDLVEKKNKNPYKSIDDLAEGHPAFAQAAVDNYFDLYRQGLVEKKFERYDHGIAPEEMKREMVEQYEKGEKSLERISRELSDKYGMNISSSTISRRARKELDVKSRNEAKAA